MSYTEALFTRKTFQMISNTYKSGFKKSHMKIICFLSVAERDLI